MPVTPETPPPPPPPPTADDFRFGSGDSGLDEIQPDNLKAFRQAKSGDINLNGLNPFSDDEYWITENLLEKTEAELFDYFEDALELLTVGNTANEALLDHFKNGTGEAYYNDTLAQIIEFGDGDHLDDRGVGQFMNSLFLRICDEWNNLIGQCIGEINFDLTALRYPFFPMSDSNFKTQLVGIQVAISFVDGDGNLSAELYDTFGVSEEDAIKRDSRFGNTISGGAIGTKAMRILQTHFGKKPFVHVVGIDPIAMGENNFNLNDCN